MARLTLITGRTSRQAAAMHEGKGSQAYHEQGAVLEMARDDMERLGLAEGARVRLRTAAGEAELILRVADLPAGLAFLPLGPQANALVGGETAGTGMPGFKGLEVEVEPG